MSASPSPAARVRAVLARRAGVLTLAAVTVLVAWVAAPILVFPQLDPDDYRYLDLVQQLRTGRIGWLTASIIENRWDHLWWVDSEQVVRFFRPTLLLSFVADDLLHGGSARGLLLSNALLYLATCLVAALLLRRLLPPLPAALASLLFAGFAAHAETIWYVCGRNETLAALGFLAALYAHGSARRARWLAVPCFAFAVAAKELTLPMPVLALLHDRFVARRAPTLRGCLRARAGLYAGYAAIAAVYLGVRQLVIARAGGSDLVFPYFVAPDRAGFAAHVANQIRTYGENLFLGGVTPPFLRADQVAAFTTALGTALTCALPPAALLLLRREPRAWWLLALALATWLPTSVVYVSERYVFLPSFALAGIAGACAARFPRAGALVLVVWCAHQAIRLRGRNTVISQTPHPTAALHAHLLALRDRLPPGKPIYVLNLPADVFGAQFLPSLVRVVLDDPTRESHVLTVLPERWIDLQTSSVRRAGPAELEVRGEPWLMAHPRLRFPWTSLATGTRAGRARAGCAVAVVDGAATRCTALLFSLPRPLDDCIFLRFTLLPSSVPKPHGVLVREGNVDVLKP